LLTEILVLNLKAAGEHSSHLPITPVFFSSTISAHSTIDNQ